MNLEEEIEQLQNENKQQKKLLLYAQYIMSFHTYRCPMNIDNNFSGSEEHLAMYRDIRDMLEQYKGEIDWKEWYKESTDRIMEFNNKRK